MADNKTNYPSVPSYHWWNLREKLKQTIPGTINSIYLSSVLSMNQRSANTNIIPGLRGIGLIDSDDKTNTELAKRLRDDAEYSSACQEIIRKVYPQDLLDAFPNPLENKDGVKRWFSNTTGSGESAVNKMVAFYLLLADGTPSKPTGRQSNNGKPKSNSIPPKNEHQRKVSIPVQNPGMAHDSSPESKKLNNFSAPQLHINIQIHISPDASSEQIEAMFASMAKHLKDL